MRRPARSFAWLWGVALVAIGGFVAFRYAGGAFDRVTGGGDERPAPPPPGGKVEGAPAPDNTITEAPPPPRAGEPTPPPEKP